MPDFDVKDDDVYEGSETFKMTIESGPSTVLDLVQFAYPNGTTCQPPCSRTPKYTITITDDEDLPTLSLSVDPASIDEEDDAGTTDAENVSTVTVETTNSKTFARDTTVTLTFGGTATGGTHYTVSPADADAVAANHQVVLTKETGSVEVTVTAAANSSADGNRTVTVAGALGGTSIGNATITIVDDETTSATVPGAPTGLTATADGTTAIDLSWTTPSDNGGSAITGYKIEVSPDGTSDWTDLEDDTGGTGTTYEHTGLSAGTTRHYRVSAINAIGTGTASGTASATTATTVPGAPTGLTATADGSTGIDLSWTAPTDDGGEAITGYKIEVSPDGTSDWTELVASNTGTTYSHTGLSAGDTRHYRVSAINANGTGNASGTASATTATAVPGAPTSLTATASGTSTIDLSWTAPTDDGGSEITGYRIQSSPNGTSNWSNLVGNTGGTGTTYSHTGLSAGTTRHYRVRAINANGAGAASNVDDATTATTVPGAPTGLTATASGTSTINLSWTAPSSDGGSEITGYRIEVSPNGSSNWSNLVGNTNSTGTTYSHTGLSAGTTRHYRVSAINANGTGNASGTANATTNTSTTTVAGAPTNLTATASGTSTINLSWTAPSDDGGEAITGYRIEVSPNGSSNWSNLVGNTNSTGTTYSHTGLSAGTTRHYRVSAINANGTGNASGTANATTNTSTTTVPGAPTNLTATASGTSTINLSWTAPSDDGGSSITGYRIEVSPNGTSNWSNLVGNTNSTGTTYSHTGLSAGTTRHYRVSAINANGTGTASGTANATTNAVGKAVLTMHALAVSVTVEGLARFEIRRSGGDMGWLKISYRVDESDGNYGKAWGYFKPGDTRKDAYYYVGQSTGTVTARVTGPSDPLCTPNDHPNAACTDDYDIGDPSSASMQVTASSASSADALEEALAVAEGLTPDEAAGALFGEVRLSEARLAALDLLGNGNGRYDLGDLLAWIDRCKRGEARCGTTSADSPPPSAAGLAAAAVAAGRPRISRRTRRRGSGRPGRTPLRTARRRRGRFAGYALAALLAAATTLSCADGPVGPAAHVPDPGFLTVEWSGAAAGRGSGVLLELEGPGIETVRAPGFELYESTAPGRHRIVVAGSLRAGPLVQFRVPDRGRLFLYRVRVIEVTGEDYQLRDPGKYRAVIADRQASK